MFTGSLQRAFSDSRRVFLGSPQRVSGVSAYHMDFFMGKRFSGF